MDTPADRPLTAQDVAKLLGVSRSAVYRLPIPFYAYGRARRYALADVLAFKARQRRELGRQPKPGPAPKPRRRVRRDPALPDPIEFFGRGGWKRVHQPTDSRGT